MPCVLYETGLPRRRFLHCTFLFPLPTGDAGVKTRAFITSSLTFDKLPAAGRAKYEVVHPKDLAGHGRFYSGA